MNKSFRVWLAMGALVLLCAGCADVSGRKDPTAQFAHFKHLYVVHTLTDGRSVDRIIANELRKRGYLTDYGPRTEMPQDVDGAVIYQDTWTYDFTTYMIAIDLQLRTPRTDRPLAVYSARRPSLTGEPPQRLIDRVIDKIFPQRSPLPPLPPASDVPDFGNIGKG